MGKQNQNLNGRSPGRSQNQKMRVKQNQQPKQNQNSSMHRIPSQSQRVRGKQEQNPEQNLNPNRKLKRPPDLKQNLTFVFRLATATRMAGVIRTGTLSGVKLKGKHRGVLPCSVQLFQT